MLQAYILMWPLLAFIILVILVKGVLKDFAEAKKNNKDIV
ncbi:MAG: putative transporter small subunit [Alphaproteobacteria bacterium]